MSADPLHIGMIAPPWLPVPPVAYGGTELVVDALCRALDRLGHRVTLFTVGHSTCPVERRHVYEQLDPGRMGAAVEELRHTLSAYESLQDVDVIHDHTIAGLFVGPQRVSAPIITTMHGPFVEDLNALYGRIDDAVAIIAISHDQASHAPSDVTISRVIHHGIELENYRFNDRPGDGLVFLGRMSPDKGVDAAIRIAQAADRPLKIAAKMRELGEVEYFRAAIEPQLGAEVEYVGEADLPTKVNLLSSAAALINPITWDEPFGLVMIESMACGTPVIGGAMGAAREIVEQDVTGHLANDEAGLIEALRHVDRLDRHLCRRAVASRFTSDRMAVDYVEIYRDVVDGANGSTRSTAAA